MVDSSITFAYDVFEQIQYMKDYSNYTTAQLTQMILDMIPIHNEHFNIDDEAKIYLNKCIRMPNVYNECIHDFIKMLHTTPPERFVDLLKWDSYTKIRAIFDSGILDEDKHTKQIMSRRFGDISKRLYIMGCPYIQQPNNPETYTLELDTTTYPPKLMLIYRN
jgi:hypothetical protein